MARKRFTDADKWEDSWYIDQSLIVKCFWNYICDRCDCSGVWEAAWRLAEFHLGKLDKDELIHALGDRIRVICDGRKWLITGFLDFQYPKGLSETSPVHKKIRIVLKRNGLTYDGARVVEDVDNSSPTVGRRVGFPTVDPTVVEEDTDTEEDIDSISDAGAHEAPPSGVPTPSDAQVFAYEAPGLPWVNNLRVIGAKIHAPSFRVWKILIETHGESKVHDAVMSLPTTKRFMDDVAGILAGSTASNADLAKAVYAKFSAKAQCQVFAPGSLLLDVLRACGGPGLTKLIKIAKESGELNADAVTQRFQGTKSAYDPEQWDTEPLTRLPVPMTDDEIRAMVTA